MIALRRTDQYVLENPYSNINVCHDNRSLRVKFALLKWTNIEQMHPQLYLHLTSPQETRQIPHRAFPSSKTKILGPPPTPKYT
ncbi:hypothetical protein FHG87_008821 [Trinorchestia longiramus]|nr:hypothetical protein FHG87_008821 [Trinorchestia longiramus]